MHASEAALLPLIHKLLPFLRWLPGLRRSDLRPDLEAGLIGAVLILPQAIALATLAGMPPEYGIYASIIPVVVAALWGSSIHTLSGPNTALCVLIAGSVAPFANPASPDYIGYVLALTLMVGIIQLALGLARLGNLLDFISHTVISALVLAVGLVIIVSAGGAFLGVLTNLDEPFFYRLYQLAHDLQRANPYALTVGGATVVTGLLMKRWMPRYALVAAVVVGSLTGALFNWLLGPATTGIELLGRLSLSALPLSMPHFNMESMYVLKELVAAAFAIAFLGLMQTIVIARGLAAKSGQVIDGNQEIVAQGLSNLIAPFLSSFAGSGSFNRSAVHYAAGARTPMAALYASALLALLVFIGGSLIVHMPMPAVAGALVLVGLGLFDAEELRRVFHQRRELAIFVATLGSALLFGLNTGVFVGLGISLVIYLWFASTPNITIRRNHAVDGRPVYSVIIDGNLFFGSVHYVERALQHAARENEEPGVMLVRTEHLSYLDQPGVGMLAAEARRQRERGGEFYLYVSRPEVLRALRRSGRLAEIGEEHILERDRYHPMKRVLLPVSLPTSRPADEENERRLVALLAARGEEEFLGKSPELLGLLVRHLQVSPLLGGVTEHCLRDLLQPEPVRFAEAGARLADPTDARAYYLVVIDGEVEVERYWREESGVERRYQRMVDRHQQQGVAMLVGAKAQRVSLRAMTPTHYLLLDGETVESAFGVSQQFALSGERGGEESGDSSPGQPNRQPGVLRHLPVENVEEALRRLSPREVQAGDVVISQGSRPDAYYLIDEGEAVVLVTDASGSQSHTVAFLGPGDAFGEEALLKDLTRNATVRMLTPGRLQVLERADFEELVRPQLVAEMGLKEAQRLVKQGRAGWIDCRYRQEFDQAHLPGARSMPLHELRLLAPTLERDKRYIVYSRRGRRAAAAVFLLRQRNIDAYTLQGGLSEWPGDVAVSGGEGGDA